MRESSVRDAFFIVALGVLVLFALAWGRPYLLPVATAVLIWFLINAMTGVLRRAAPRLPDWAALSLSLGVITVALLTVAQVITANVGALSAAASNVEAALIERVNRVMGSLGAAEDLEFAGILQSMNLRDHARTAFDMARGVAANVGLILLFVMFLLIDQKFYGAKLRALVPDDRRRAFVQETLNTIAADTRAYLWIMTLLSAGVGGATWLICVAFGVSGAAFWGFLAFALNFIPVIGTWLGVILPSLYALLQLTEGGELTLFVLALAAMQFTAGQVFMPRMMGARLNLSGFVIVFSLVLWGALWGPAGMFLAVPITVILMIVFARFDGTRPLAVALSRNGEVDVIPHVEPHH